MADRGVAGELFHQPVALGRVVEGERLVNRTQFLVGLENSVAGGVIAGQSGAELSPVLHFQEPAHHQGGDVPLPVAFAHLVDGDDAAFFLQALHLGPGSSGLEQRRTKTQRNRSNGEKQCDGAGGAAA